MSNETPGTESEAFLCYVEALDQLIEEWKGVNLDVEEVATKFKGTDVEFLLAKISLEHLRNTILLTMLDFYEKALASVQMEANRVALTKSRDVTASTLGIYMGAAARLSSVN